MQLSPALQQTYTRERLSARDAQRQAEFIAFGPMVFQVSRLMVKFGVLDALRDSDAGMTRTEVARACRLSDYAAGVLLDASLSIGTVLVEAEAAPPRYRLSKTGWFLLSDPATRANMAFNHDVCYRGMFHLETALREVRPAGLAELGPWATIYEGLSSLPPEVQESWFGFDHFYSDHSFDEALAIVFGQGRVKTLLDVGGNTGRWALRCVAHDPAVRVTIVDLPQQIALMREATSGHEGADRIDGVGMNLLDDRAAFPAAPAFDAIWMSQFLDCFSPTEITSILRRAAAVMQPATRLYIMETLWDRQRFEPAAMCLTLTSLYFTALANGNSRMYDTDELSRCVTEAGLEIETIHDHLGQGHSIVVCRKN